MRDHDLRDLIDCASANAEAQPAHEELDGFRGFLDEGEQVD